MRLATRVVIATSLAFGSGCAQTDWIDRTLVTVDVTGTWIGKAGGVGGSITTPNSVVLELDQQGPTVQGFIRTNFLSFGDPSGPIAGTVAGDVFRFRNTRGDAEGELTVSGDEMTGQMTWGTAGQHPFTMRRVDSSSPPDSPRR